MQLARAEKSREWSWLEHLSPCPALGDPDGAEIHGDGIFCFWNPQGRPLEFRVGTYLPRSEGVKARVLMQAGGRSILDREDPILHLHGEDSRPAGALRRTVRSS